jgi:hypothetical protein
MTYRIHVPVCVSARQNWSGVCGRVNSPVTREGLSPLLVRGPGDSEPIAVGNKTHRQPDHYPQLIRTPCVTETRLLSSQWIKEGFYYSLNDLRR